MGLGSVVFSALIYPASGQVPVSAEQWFPAMWYAQLGCDMGLDEADEIAQEGAQRHSRCRRAEQILDS